MSALPAEAVVVVMVCQCCGEEYRDPNDHAVFGTLIAANGQVWRLCGPCIQVMWRERAPRPEPVRM